MAVVGSRKCCVVVVMSVAGHSVACRRGSQRVVSRVIVWKPSTICARMVMAREEEWKNGALQGVVRSAFSSLVGRVCEALAPKSGGCHQRPPEWDSREDLFLDEGATVVFSVRLETVRNSSLLRA